ncbi:MAG: sugar ABC transporter ATP-binding protein [Synergistaceae bacterium]|nr:sugar ABC transporter ATP-binding protein [Synergistaceae bacterium]
MNESSADVILRMSGIKKSFASVEVLHGVDFTLKRGEIHALIGENGAGKSTLIKCLGGIIRADEGTVQIDGQPAQIGGIEDAERYGISIIHQELSLVSHMTVAENIYLGHMPLKRGFIDNRAMEKNARVILDAVGLEKIAVSRECGELTVAQQQMVEIARALAAKTRIIVMDEPTASLTEREAERLFEIARRYRGEGISIIYISHKLEEIFKIADNITVLRDGWSVGAKKPSEVTYDGLVSMMVGREYTGHYPRSGYTGGEEALRVENFSSPKMFQNIGFTVHKGEVLGFYGLIGSGRTEVMRGIFGIDENASGEIYVGGKRVVISNPGDAIASGIALSPESRKEHGLILEQTVSFNVMLTVLKKFIKGISIDENYERQTLSAYIERLKIKLKSVFQPVKSLSGGNQQKIVLAKWLAASPDVLILDEPTRGIDVGAKHEIYQLITELARQGMAIVFISSELPEIMGLSDNIVVFHEGRQTGFVTRDKIHEATILRYAMGEVR